MHRRGGGDGDGGGAVELRRLAELLQRQGELLKELFGGDFRIVELDESCCSIRTVAAEIQLAYDRRDGFLASEIAALFVPETLRDSHIIASWLRFLDVEVPAQPRGQLDNQQVMNELLLVRRILTEILSNPERARDAANFCAGYNAAYNDRYSGLWDAQS